MTQINRLQAALRAHLPWHGARLTFLALFLVALFRVETVNLDKLSSVFANQAKPESSYNSDERIDLLERFERVFPNAKVHGLMGDREFVGKDWCSYLLLPKTIDRAYLDKPQRPLRHCGAIDSPVAVCSGPVVHGKVGKVASESG